MVAKDILFNGQLQGSLALVGTVCKPERLVILPNSRPKNPQQGNGCLE